MGKAHKVSARGSSTQQTRAVRLRRGSNSSAALPAMTCNGLYQERVPARQARAAPGAQHCVPFSSETVQIQISGLYSIDSATDAAKRDICEHRPFWRGGGVRFAGVGRWAGKRLEGARAKQQAGSARQRGNGRHRSGPRRVDGDLVGGGIAGDNAGGIAEGAKQTELRSVVLVDGREVVVVSLS